MDLYLFIQTEPGMATAVMNALVESKAVARAASVTGPFDVFARIDNVEFDQLTARLVDGVQRTPGVLRTTTSAGLPADVMAAVFPVPLMPLRVTVRGNQALVFITIQPGTGASVVQQLASKKSVLSLGILTGEYDAVMQVGGTNIESIARKVLRDIAGISGISSTMTCLVADVTPLPAQAQRKAPKQRVKASVKRGRSSRRRKR